jgi:hypothetical protein
MKLGSRRDSLLYAIFCMRGANSVFGSSSQEDELHNGELARRRILGEAQVQGARGGGRGDWM